MCSTGQSSKEGSQGYIGKKGIGFKSVFGVAWKVHVQSGHFSFSFIHRPGDSGMGMIQPIWENVQEELEHPLTRITLYLHGTVDGSKLASTRETVEQHFNELQGTVLLFMRKLRKIDIKVFEDDGGKKLTSETSYSIERPKRLNYVILRKSTSSGNSRAPAKEAKYFHITTHEATNLGHEDKTHSRTETLTRAHSNPEVALAFPLSEMDVPVIEPQNVFVFLPVRAAGFNFIIHANFDTDASRQDIIKDSLRNNGLLDSIASAFVKAVLQFCESDKLRYQWMKYLPGRKDSNMDKFWRSLTGKIADRLGEEPVLFCHKKKDPHLIQDLVLLPNKYRYKDQPLFDDGDREKIVSENYTKEDLMILQEYGLPTPNIGEVHEWVRQDLKTGPLSRMKSTPASDNWHTQATKVFHRSFQKRWAHRIAELRQMDLLPLENGEWVSITSGPVYFSQVDGIYIPPDLNLRIISREVTDSYRLDLFKLLGTKPATVARVRKAILRRYTMDEGPTELPFESSKSHLEFLYLTQHLMGEDEPSYERLSIHGYVGKDPTVIRPAHNFTYIADETDPYGPWELFREIEPGPRDDGAPGYPAFFVDEEYFESIPRKPDQQQLTWVEWFHEHLDVKKYVSFTPRNSESWKLGGGYLQKEKPEKIIGALRIHYQHNPETTEEFVQCVQQTDVACRGGWIFPMREAYFAIQRLEGLVAEYVEPDAIFPWLWLEEEAVYDAIPPDWKNMFTRYGIGSVEDLDFALGMLRHSLKSAKGKKRFTRSSRTRLFGLYLHIQSKYREAENKPAAEKKLR